MRLAARLARKWRREGTSGLAAAMIRRLRGRRPGLPPVRMALEEIVRQPSFTIVQIGAYVGNSSNDPVYPLLRTHAGRLARTNPPDHRVVLVEPVREYFERLVANYAGIPGTSFENVAISDRDGPATFHRLTVDPVTYGFPEWLAQLGSLKKERMGEIWERHEANAECQRFWREHSVSETVECLSFETLARRHELERIDLLQMDVEGSEYDILRTVDFSHLPIRFINYESVLLQEANPFCVELLARHGFRLMDHGDDTFAHTAADEPFMARWRRCARE